jgi:pyruvate formate lyase activating enzyme
VVKEAEKDAIFYKNSGGGVTVSGGEPLLQHEFLAELLQHLKKKGMQVAVDTSGYAPKSVLKTIVDHVDLVLFDIKHLDPKIHRAHTGVENGIILKNARYVAQRATTWFRMALIAGINDSVEHIQQVSELAANLGVEKLSLLPYHEGGKSKCLQIGKSYGMKGDRTPNPDHIDNLIQTATRIGITTTVRH